MKKFLSAKNPLTALQHHLYRNPLYEYLGADDAELNVVLLGFGKYGANFLDSCLQVGQALSAKLNVEIFSDDDTDCYLRARPALKDFFGVNRSDNSKESYGNIFFEAAVAEANESDLKIFFAEIVGHVHYIFIDAGDDAESARVAILCKKVLDDLKRKASISFVREATDTKRFPRGVIPIYVNGEVKNSSLHAELERMAFNAHLVWKKNLNVDYGEARKEFLEPYNHDASVAAVLAVKYKLHDFGLNPDAADKVELARKFSELTFDECAKNEFIFVEHKRWVTEKICAGWRRRPVEECADGLLKDKRNKLHPCIVTSRADRLLRDNYPVESWATLTKSELTLLDELDRVSVNLHKIFSEQARAIRNEPDLLNKLTDNLLATPDFDARTLAAFRELKVCFTDILNGDAKKVPLYQNLRDTFLRHVEKLPPAVASVVKENFAVLDKRLQPILLSMEFRDYKQDDAAMVEKIPFILTYSENVRLVVPFAVGELSAMFGNVAAATVINPKKILYVAYCRSAAEVAVVKNSLPNLLAYCARKNLHAKLDFAIACADKSLDFAAEIQAIRRGARGQVQQVFFGRVKDADKPAAEVIAFVRKILARLRKNFPDDFTALEFNATTVSNWLQGAGVCGELPSYSFDSARMKFTSLNQCDTFAYIAKKNFLMMNDLTALNNSFGEVEGQATFMEDYRELWDKFKLNGGRDWKILCERLRSHAEANDVIAFFSRKADNSVKHYRYLLPTDCFKVVEKILHVLKREKIAEERSLVRIFNATTCEVIIVDRCKNLAAYNKLFANPYKLMVSEAIDFLPVRSKFAVLFDDLIVSNLALNPNDNLSGVLDLINFFHEKNYLTNLNANDASNISFTYATRAIKNLLTNEGKMLEVFVYHEAKRTGGFDDVMMNFKPHWSDADISNELDCVLSKDFRLLIVECKAQDKIDQNVYFKLFGLAQKFGVNATAVLVSYSRGANAASNDLQQRRGNEMNIVTIRDGLDNIGETLLKIIDAE